MASPAAGVATQEQQRAERLVLRRRGYLPFDGERAKELRDLRRSHLGRVALAMKHDEAANPTDVRLFGAAAAMTQPIGRSTRSRSLGERAMLGSA